MGQVLLTGFDFADLVLSSSFVFSTQVPRALGCSILISTCGFLSSCGEGTTCYYDLDLGVVSDAPIDREW